MLFCLTRSSVRSPLVIEFTRCVTIMGQDLSSRGESSELATCVLAVLDLATAELWAELCPLCQHRLQLRDWQAGRMSWWSFSGAAVTRALLPLSQTSGCFLDSSCASCSSQNLLQRIWAPRQLLPYVGHDNLMLFATPFFQGKLH